MLPFIHQDFLLQSKSAERLFQEFAGPEPILDYHCHLSPADIANNRQFASLFEIWLEGDHYKWRAMRANGEPERYCTGDASPKEKFLAYARTAPHTLRNPLYHWTHLELSRYFGITELLNEASAERIWDEANQQLAAPELTTQGILRRFSVRAVCTTDDPADDLRHHLAHATTNPATAIFPTFRPDKALLVNHPEAFNRWLAALEISSGVSIESAQSLVGALEQRHDAFHAAGCRLSDHGLNHAFADPCTDSEAALIFSHAQDGHPASPHEHAGFAAWMMLHFGRMDAQKGWTKQLHVGARRNNNSRRLAELGPDTGFDSIGDWPQIDSLASYLDRLDAENSLPRTILYNLNPADNYAFATLAGNFQDGQIAGKIQFGSGWWFLDQKEAIEWQINALSNAGLLSRFIGMLTDSRSFMSFPRHEYFRRVLCNLLGDDMERGLLPGDFRLIGDLVRRVCYRNAEQFLRLPVPPAVS